MLFETCSGDNHFFNNMFNGRTWDRKCDCGKLKLSKKKYEEFLEELKDKVKKLKDE